MRYKPHYMPTLIVALKDYTHIVPYRIIVILAEIYKHMIGSNRYTGRPIEMLGLHFILSNGKSCHRKEAKDTAKNSTCCCIQEKQVYIIFVSYVPQW